MKKILQKYSKFSFHQYCVQCFQREQITVPWLTCVLVNP